MFDIGWSELLVIAVVAIVVIGPKELPRMMRTFGHYTGKLRRAAAEFQRQFEEAVRETEIDEVRKAMDDFHDTSKQITDAIDKPVMTGTPPAASAGPSTLPPAPPTEPVKPRRKTSAKAPVKSPAPKPKAPPRKTAASKPRKPKGAAS